MGPRRTRSELEDRFRELLADSGLCRPTPTSSWTELLAPTRWTCTGLLVSWSWSSTASRFTVLEATASDAARDADLELAGQRVVRFTWDDVSKHEDRTLRRLRNLVE